MNGFYIRAARVEEVPLILQFIRELAEYERLADEVTATEQGLRESLFGGKSCAEVFFGVLDGRPVAFAVVFHNFSTFLGRPGLYLEDLFVKPEFRGRGYGKAMLLHLVGVALQRGCGRLEWAVLDWNQPAIRFYRALGARGMEDWTVYRFTQERLEALAARTDRAAPSAERGASSSRSSGEGQGA
jgi:GNAT superfamily N-acetyltransferase